MKFLAATILASFVSISQGLNQLTVQTKQGPVTGTLVAPGVRRFLGIPYAAVKRWEAPQSPPVRNTTFQATSFGDTCVQQLNAANLGFLNLTGLLTHQVRESEDCLSVNIWTPSIDRKQDTAVMIWVYGGSFEFGTSDTIFYDGQAMIHDNDDVLLVTFNYRTNIFGFPNAPQLSSSVTSQNFGALDVTAAIHWVHDNIAAFGGNPDRIVLFGQSAGAALISSYKFAHPSDTIVKGTIEQSGNLIGTPGIMFSQPLDSVSWDTTASVVGCGDENTRLACMKAVPFRTLEDAAIKAYSWFVPVQDNITFFTNPAALSAAGQFLHVPLLVGNTAQEGEIYMIRLFLDPTLSAYIPLYNVSAQISARDFITNYFFDCPASTAAAVYASAGVPVWRYRYEAVFPDISHIPGMLAFHSSEIPIVFGTSNLSIFRPPPSLDEIALSKYVQGAWVAFARDPQQGLSKYGWPLFHPQTTSLVRLGNSTNQTGAIFTKGNFFDGSCLGLTFSMDLFWFVLALGLVL